MIIHYNKSNYSSDELIIGTKVGIIRYEDHYFEQLVKLSWKLKFVEKYLFSISQ